MRSMASGASAGSPPPTVTIHLENSSWVEGRGVRHVEWSVLLNDAWTPVRELRGVAATLADPEIWFDDDVDDLLVLPPGCQYRITYHLRVPVGTRLRKRTSTPRHPRSRRGEPPATLEGAVRHLVGAFPPMKPPLRTTTTECRVIGNNRFVSEERWQLSHQRRRPHREAATREALPEPRDASVSAAMGDEERLHRRRTA
jgi:hypothetical protein